VANNREIIEDKVIVMETKSHQVELAQRMAAERIESFADRYGDAALDFAAHCAFPLTLTTELTYCLRETFAPYLNWSIAPQLLLSVLCDEVEHDLYGMEVAVRGALLIHLIENCGRGRLDQLAKFMGDYIHKGIAAERHYRSRVFGDPPDAIKYTALSLLKRNDQVTAKIKQDFQQLLAETDDPRQRLQLALLVENQYDLLAAEGLELPELLNFAQSTADDRSGDEFGRITKAIAKAKFPPLQSKEIEYATISFEQTAIDSGDALYSFEFETVQVDERGKIIDRSQDKAFAFREPLAPEIGLEMVAIPSGKFMMGSPDTEHDRFSDESPEHEVTIQPFFIGKYPITQAQWRVIANTPQIERELNPDPSNFKGDNRPVEQVSWEEAVEFCQRLSRETKRDYRLSTEAEWEYACRAGTITPFYFGKTIAGKLANYDSYVTYLQERKVKSKGATTPVGDFPPNAFGLYDLHGNVWEWCLDHWHDNYEGAPTDGSAWLSDNEGARRLLRGGSWDCYPRDCRSATRDFYAPAIRLLNIGFRVVCEIPRT
jgi:formylglycine-generating enzyme required for sulfatase activity